MLLLSDSLTLHTSSLVILLAVAFLGGLVLNMWRSDVDVTAKHFMLLISATTALLAIAFVVQKESDVWRNGVYTFISLQMLYGPFLYLYTRYQCDLRYRWEPIQWLHFLPALLFALLWLVQQPIDSQSVFYFDCEHIDCTELQKHRFWHKVAAWVSIFSYTFISLRWLHPHRENIKARFSTLDGIDLRWLQSAAWSLLALTVIAIFADLSREFGLRHTIRGGHLQALGPFISIFLFAKYGIYQKKVYSDADIASDLSRGANGIEDSRLINDANLRLGDAKGINESNLDVAFKLALTQSSKHNIACEVNQETNTSRDTLKTNSQTIASQSPANLASASQINKKKYQTSSLTESCASILWQQLQDVMHREQPYLEPGLKISSLATRLDVSVNHLSETINGYAKLSFYDYINALRIEEASRLLLSHQQSHLSVTDIGYQAGFNSSSTFYTHFKKSTGCTPRQYREQQGAIAGSVGS